MAPELVHAVRRDHNLCQMRVPHLAHQLLKASTQATVDREGAQLCSDATINVWWLKRRRKRR